MESVNKNQLQICYRNTFDSIPDTAIDSFKVLLVGGGQKDFTNKDSVNWLFVKSCG
mgnify:CR=1 FL=1